MKLKPIVSHFNRERIAAVVRDIARCRMLRDAAALLVNLLIVYLIYTLCRLIFFLCNHGLYEGIGFSHCLDIFRAGIIFDSSAIVYTNAVIILMFLLPLHFKERCGYYRVGRWIYVVVNTVCVIANLCDVVYFNYTGKRTTFSTFTEFANEGAGNLFNVFADRIVHNWWLLLAAILMVWMLWKGYRTPSTLCCSRKATADGGSASRCSDGGIVKSVYYPVGVVLLALGIFLSVGLMRGGFSHAVRPITISNANKYADSPSEAGLVLNTPFALIRTINKKPLVVPDYMPQKQAEAVYSPLHTPSLHPDDVPADTTGLHPAIFRDYNVVILIMESFSKQHFGFFNDLHGENGPEGDKMTFTPFLDSMLANDAYSFRYSYANGRRSIEAMPSVLSSIPNFVEPFFLTPATLNDLSGIARELSENKGYTSAFFHGAENGSMGFEAFAHSTGFQRYYGRTEYNRDPNYNGDDDYDGTWAIFDEEFMLYSADRMSEMKQPFVASIFTATSHPPFTLPERYKGKFPKGDDELQETIGYSDNALRVFFEKAKKQPWYDNTVFVITADHTSVPQDKFYETVWGHYCVPIIFYAPGIPALKGYDTERIVSQSDIMPTLFGLLGYDREYVAFGQDIFNTPVEKKWAIHWVPEYEGYEFIKGDYAVRFVDGRITAAYRYREDLLQKNDILGEIPREQLDSIDTEIKAIIQQYMRSLVQNRLTPATYRKP